MLVAVGEGAISLHPCSACFRFAWRDHCSSGSGPSGRSARAPMPEGDTLFRTAATLQKNLAVIDQAIGESRAALRTQPASEPAQASLVENFKAKIGLLQDTVALINEMRKGNEAGAARIVSGLKQKGD